GQWGGLNEITRYPEIATNHNPSEYAFGGAGGVVYKNMKASEYRKGSQLTYSLTNRNYNHRLSYRFSSGMNKKGWAFTGMIARRWAEEGWQEGTFYDAYGGYLGIEKKVNDKHTLALNVIASPYRRSTASPATQEVYDYRGIKYNAYWGWQNGEKRSERVRKGFQPLIQLSDYWKISDKSELWTTVSYQFGKDKGSRLDWQNVQNPSPLYYRNLPSYYAGLANPSVDQLVDGAAWTDRWINNDQEYTQINWDKLYRANAAQNIENHYGQTGRRALYYLVNDVVDDKIWNVGTHFIHNFTDNVKFLLNVHYQNYYSDQYREVKDLLGADFALNRDPFAARNQPLLSGLFNEGEDKVGKVVGDKIGYDYTFRRQDVKINPSLKVNLNKFDVFVSALASYTTNNREGKFLNYLYKDSYGKSKNHEFFNFGLKGQIVYKIDGRNFLIYNGAYFSQAPFLEDLFINARLNNVTAPNIKNTVVNANDISYVVSSPFVKVRATAYLVNTYNDTNVQRFFADGIRLTNTVEEGTTSEVESAFVTQVMSNVERKNIGAELGLEVKVTPTLSLNGLASYGKYSYENKPNVYFLSDAIGTFSNGQTYINYGQSYIKGFRQGGTPQEAYSVGLRYNSPKYWWVGANWNYLGNNFL
ncbi:MAG: peptidase, partial [Cruoricaptor ignavus]|nr:peptidase [Cruoricaptor ignavus]